MSVQASLSGGEDVYVLVAPTTSTVGPNVYHVETAGGVPLCNSTGPHGADYDRELLDAVADNGAELCSTCRTKLENRGRDASDYSS